MACLVLASAAMNTRRYLGALFLAAASTVGGCAVDSGAPDADDVDAIDWSLSYDDPMKSVQSDSLWIRALYEDVLDREPGDGEVALWRNALNTGWTRLEVALSFVNSEEANHNFIRNAYVTYLRRDADEAGANGYLASMAKYDPSASSSEGNRWENVLEELLASDEYFQNVAGGVRATFVATLYGDLLGHAPTPANLQKIADSSATRRTIVRDVLQSKEYRRRVVEALYTKFYDRAPTPAEVEKLLPHFEYVHGKYFPARQTRIGYEFLAKFDYYTHVTSKKHPCARVGLKNYSQRCEGNVSVACLEASVFKTNCGSQHCIAGEVGLACE